MNVAFFVAAINEQNVYNLRLAELLIRSVRKHMPKATIIQMTDESTPRVMGTDVCVRKKRDMPLMTYRMAHMAHMPEHTIFVDTDVMFREDVSGVFDQDFDVALTERRNQLIIHEGTLENVADTMPYNTGVMFSKSRPFWEAAYHRAQRMGEPECNWFGDQLAVKETAESGAFKVLELPCDTYNYSPNSDKEDVSARKVLHFKGKRKEWMLLDKFLVLDGVEVPKYRTFSATDDGRRGQHMKEALSHGYPLLRQTPFHDGHISIACYGPSLKDTWSGLERPILSVSGAHDFLIERGVVPDFHIDCDPREYKAEFVKNAHPDVHYLMASCCHPKTWEYLQGRKVSLWHLYNGQETTRWLSSNRPDKDTVPPSETPHVAICGGSTIGLRAIELAGFMGYKNIALHGMDSSFAGDVRHAGVHHGEKQKPVRVRVGDEWFQSSPQMIEAARETINVIGRYAPVGVRFTFYGNGMLQAMVAHSLNGVEDFKVAA